MATGYLASRDDAQYWSVTRLIRYCRFAALTILASILILLCFRTTGVSALLEEDLSQAEALAPSDPRVKLALARSVLEQQQGLVSGRSLRLALAAASSEPLALESVLLAGAAASDDGDLGRAERLLIEARRRNPRSPLVRTYLLDLYAKRGRLSESALELAALIRLVPDASGGLFVQQLGYFARIPDAAAHLKQALRTDPNVRQSVLLHLVQNGTEPDLIVQIADRSKGSNQKGALEAWQMPLVDRLVDASDVDTAHQLWLVFNGQKAGSSQPLVNNGTFARPLRPLPFGWRFHESGAGVTEIRANKSLDVVYYGREAGELARQLLVLSPGRYRLNITLSGNGSSDVSAMAWRVSCSQSGSELAALPLGEVSSGTKQIASEFTVPSGCKGQWLSLVGKPPEFSRTETVSFRSVDIRPFS
jgi:tetratricopeptide (TPR) repeat protein